MILQFKNCYMLPQPRKPAVPLAFPFFHYIYSESTVSRLSDPLPHYKQQKPVTHSTHAIRLSFLDRALPTFSPNLFSSCSASAFCLPLSERRLFRFNPIVFLVALRVKIVLSHTPVSLLITFDFTFYIIVFFLCTCQVVTPIKYSVFFDMICAQAYVCLSPFFCIGFAPTNHLVSACVLSSHPPLSSLFLRVVPRLCFGRHNRVVFHILPLIKKASNLVFSARFKGCFSLVRLFLFHVLPKFFRHINQTDSVKNRINV